MKQACDYTYIVLCFSFGSLLQIAMEKIYQGIGAMKTTMILLGAGRQLLAHQISDRRNRSFSGDRNNTSGDNAGRYSHCRTPGR